MGNRIAPKLSRFPLAGNAVHAKSTFLSVPGAPAEATPLLQSNYDTSEPADGWFYSTLAESPPALELVTDMLGSTAIISARMSRMG
jgi:hypothetical protein